MGILESIACRLTAGSTIQFRPSGSSMVPLIRSRQLVMVAPVHPARVEVGDIVLARVAGTVYLHLVSAVDDANGRVQISEPFSSWVAVRFDVVQDDDGLRDRGGAAGTAAKLGEDFPRFEGGVGAFPAGADTGMAAVHSLLSA
jgi:hypothetical protein